LSDSKRLAIIGGGYVGLNMAVHAALMGFDTLVIDIDSRVVEAINTSSRLHVTDPYVVSNWATIKSRIKASTEYSEASSYDKFIIAVNTPLKAYGRRLIEIILSEDKSLDDAIDFTPLSSVAKSLADIIKGKILLASEVTIYPNGTVERLGEPLENNSKLKLGDSILLVHSPERISPGDPRWNVFNIPRVLGGYNDDSTREGLKLYSEMLGIKVAKITGLMEAELSKLIENSHRFVNIAYISSLKSIVDYTSIDFYEALEAASTKPFGYQPYRPGYAGGPCLLKDTVMLYMWMRRLQKENPLTEVIKTAIIVNESYLEHLAQKIAKIARDRGAKKILFHGLGYKPNTEYFISEDLNTIWRLMTILREKGFDTRGFDEKIPSKSNFKTIEEAKAWADLIIGWGKEGDIKLERI